MRLLSASEEYQVWVGDLEANDAAKLLALAAPALIYCDPPWDLTWARRFRRQADEETPTMDGLWSALAQVIAAGGCPAAVEIGGERTFRANLARLEPHGLYARKVYRTTYSAGKPNHVAVFGAEPPDVEGHSHVFSTRMVQQLGIPGGTLFDPCCGTGLSARFAHSAGMRFVGMELVPARAEQCARRCAGLWP